MQIELNRASREPLYRQLASHVQQRIRNGALPAGTRLPTVRQLAQQLGVTRLTVHSAYAELQSGGWIEATVGRGTFVAQRLTDLVAPLVDNLGREVTPGGMLADLLRMTQIPGLSALAKADPAIDLMPIQAWQRATEMALTAGGTSLMTYTTPQGDVVLRSTLAETVRERGIITSPDEMMITAGVTQGMALACEVLARPGDTILVEQPTYLGLLNIASARGLRPIGLPVDQHGLDPALVEAAVIAHRPAFLYVIPTFQNPSGSSMSHERREKLIEIAERHQLTIVEDDIYGRLNYSGSNIPALKSLDLSGRVIYLTSFGKNLMPGLRLGFAIAEPNLIQRMVFARQALDICSPLLTQRALAIFIEQGWWHGHIKRMLPRYRERRDALLQALTRYFPQNTAWTTPQGGFSCWVTLPKDISVTDLYLSAIARGVAFAPGEVFKAQPDGKAHLRLCFSAEPPERLTEAVATLGALLRERGLHRPLTPPALADYVPVV